MVINPVRNTASTQQLRRTASGITWQSWISGMLIGTVLCVINILVLLKTGLGFGGSALVAILGAMLLKALNMLNWRNLYLAFSVALSGYFATAALDSGIAAIVIQKGTLPPIGLLLLLAIGGNLLGVLLGTVVANLFVDKERLPYPTLQPAIALLDGLSGSAPQSHRPLISGALIGAVAALLPMIAGYDTTPKIPGVPSFIALALSPLLFGSGMLIGHRASGWTLIGGIYAAAVWWLQDGAAGAASYTEHVAQPWILAVGIALAVGYSIGALFKNRSVLVRALADLAQRFQQNKQRLYIAGGLWVLLAGGAAYYYAGWPGLVAGLVATALVIVATLYLNRAGGEVGVAPLSPVLYLSLILMSLVGIGYSGVMLTAATVCCLAVSSLYFTYAIKIGGHRHEVQANEIVMTQLIGGVMGAVIGTGFIVLVARGIGFGNSAFPVPVAVSLHYLTTLASGSAAYSWLMMVLFGAGGALGFGLSFTAALPSSLGIGVLLPPAYTFTLAAGGITQWLLTRKNPGRKGSLEMFASGLAIGDGLMTVVIVLWKAFGH